VKNEPLVERRKMRRIGAEHLPEHPRSTRDDFAILTMKVVDGAAT
jgi:hypothetical protein